MKRLEWLAYALPLFVFVAPAVYELDSMQRPSRAPTIEVVAGVTDQECFEALADPARVIVVIGPDADIGPEPEADLICNVVTLSSQAG